MDSLSARVAWRLKEALGVEKAKSVVSKVATFVRRDEDGTAWVRVDGNDFDTPATATLADAAEGDVVRVEVGGGTATVSGNASDPAVGAREVEASVAPVRRSVSLNAAATAAAKSIAEAAQRVADAINQHFWADTSGIHVAYATQEEWDESNEGPNVLINSIGQLFREGLNNLLALLPAQSTTETFTGDGSTTDFTLAATPASVTSVTLLGTTYAEGTDYTLSGSTVTFATAPDSGVTVTVTYVASDTYTATGDGSTTDYTLDETPDSVASVTVGGDEMEEGTDWSLSDDVVTFATAPDSGDAIEVAYSFTLSETLSGDGSTTTLTLSYAPDSITFAGIEDEELSGWSYSGTTLTLATAPDSGDEVEVTYRLNNTAVAIFDGAGNEDSNVAAYFGEDGMRIGPTDGTHVEILPSVTRFFDQGANVVGEINQQVETSTYEKTSGLWSALNARYSTGMTKSVKFSSIVPDFDNGSLDVTLNFTAASPVVLSFDAYGTQTTTIDTGTSEYGSMTFSVAVAGDYTGSTVSVTFVSGTLGHYNMNVSLEGPFVAVYPTYFFGIPAEDVGPYAMAEGYLTAATGRASHAEGYNTVASGYYSHAEGYGSAASGYYSHTEGYNTVASGYYSHAEGYGSAASSYYSHTEGCGTVASGHGSHAEGCDSAASGYYSHAQNYGTVASTSSQTVLGTYNVEDENVVSFSFEGDGTTTSFTVVNTANILHSSVTIDGVETSDYTYSRDADRNGTVTFTTAPSSGAVIEITLYVTTHPSGGYNYGQYALIVGNGTSDSSRSNALAVTWDGIVEAVGATLSGTLAAATATLSDLLAAAKAAIGTGTIAASTDQTALGRYNEADTQTDTFTGDGSTTAFTLTATPDAILSVTIDGGESDEYSLSGATVTFDDAPDSGAAIEVEYSLGTYALIVGNGTSDSARSNAFAVDWSGNVEAAGNISANRFAGPVFIARPNGGTEIGSYLDFHATDGDSYDYLARIARSGTAIQLTTTYDGYSGSHDTDRATLSFGYTGNLGLRVYDSSSAAWGSWRYIEYEPAEATLTLTDAVAYSSGTAPVYRKWGRMVELTGVVKPSAAVAAGGSLSIGTLPSGYRPSRTFYVLCQGSSQNKWLLQVATSGAVTCSRYSTGGTLVAMTTSVWLPFHCTFLID